MSRTHKKRLNKVSQQIDALPIAPAAEKAAFERFRETGELPEHQRLAEAVIDRALGGGVVGRAVRPVDLAAAIRDLKRLGAELAESEPRPTPTRELLFREALYGCSVIKSAARQALKVLVAIGREVTDPEFIESDMELPDYGSVGLHLLGFPDCFAKPPFEDQAQRLFDRFANLRERIDRDDKRWMEELNDAAFLFLKKGELPDDELMREAVLANGELMGLLLHYVGGCDPEVMAAFDQAARAQGEARAAAIARVRAMAADGRLVPKHAFE